MDIIIITILSLLLCLIRRREKKYYNNSFIQDVCIYYSILISIKEIVYLLLQLRLLYIEESNITINELSNLNDCTYKFTKEQLILVQDECNHASIILKESTFNRFISKFYEFILDRYYYNNNIWEYNITLIIIIMNNIFIIYRVYMILLNCIYKRRSKHAEEYISQKTQHFYLLEMNT